MPQMPMHRSDFDGDAYVTVCIGQILKFLSILQIIYILLSFTFSQLQISVKMHLSDFGSGSNPALQLNKNLCVFAIL